jgi:hypothetical protein
MVNASISRALSLAVEFWTASAAVLLVAVKLPLMV